MTRNVANITIIVHLWQSNTLIKHVNIKKWLFTEGDMSLNYLDYHESDYIQLLTIILHLLQSNKLFENDNIKAVVIHRGT